jgi:hypothetical protein
MLMTILIILLCLTLLIPIVLFARDFFVKLKLERLTTNKYHAMKVLVDKLESKKSITETEVQAIAENPSLRIVLYYALESYGRKEMFPQKFFSEEKGAESYMVNWLEFPTELGRAPDEILLMETATIGSQLQVHYYAFKFKSAKPRWARKLNWMIGICGPYHAASLPFDVPRRVFSRFTPVGQTKTNEEIKWVHENINP